MDALDIRLRLSIVIVVVVVAWAAATGSGGWLVAAGALASQSSVRYLRLRH